MSNAHFNANGSIHQTRYCFIEVSLGNNVLLRVFWLSQFPVTRSVNQILIGDDMYLKAFDDQTIFDTATLMLSLYLPDRERQKCVHKNLENLC